MLKKNIADFLEGAALAGGAATIGVSSIALPLWFSVWLSGGAIWGLPVCIVLMAAMFGGSAYAINRAIKT